MHIAIFGEESWLARNIRECREIIFVIVVVLIILFGIVLCFFCVVLPVLFFCVFSPSFRRDFKAFMDDEERRALTCEE